jgi:N utilization substance protein B
MRENEVFDEYLSDHFPTWDDDESLVYGAIKRSIRELPQNTYFFIEQLPNSEFVDELGKDLLYKVLRHDEEVQQMIATRLKNWEEDRVAMLDMAMMKMAICEFLYFETIPTKVTINEYVNIAKLYSTDKSKRFINGILDRLMQEFLEEGRIKKTGRGLIDE